MQPIYDFIMTWLDPLGIVLGLVATVPMIWTWWEVVFGERRRRKRWFEAVRRDPGARPAILIVDLLPGKDIRTAVEKFRSDDPALQDIPDDRILHIARDASLTPGDMPDLLREIRETAAGILARGADKIHYFHAGPAVAAAPVGAEFANAVPVNLYHFQSGKYINFGPLRPPP